MRGQQLFRFVLGAALIAAACGCAWTPASAQNLRPALTDDAAPLPPSRPRTAPARRNQPANLEPDPPPAAQMRRTVMDNPTQDGETASPDPSEEPTVDTPTGVRPAIRDGEPQGETEPEVLTDGVIEEEQPYRNPDGLDPVQWDSRAPEDADAFERPPAGHDGPAFGVELAPLNDRRPYYLYRFEPWDPRGIRLGSFTVYPQADIGAAWVSNLYRTKPARPDQAIELRPTIRAVSNWSAHALELRATAGLSFFDEHPKEDDRAYALEARGRLDITRRTQLSGGLRHEVYQEARGSLEARLRDTTRPDIEINEARLQLDHSFNRLAVQLRGVAAQRTYESTLAADGSVQSNRDRNLHATEQALRLSWTFKPTFIAFAETGLNQRRYEAAAQVDGIKRDSDGERYQVGVGFGNTGNILRGEVSVGYGRQTPLDPRLQPIDGMVLDANVAWRASAFTSLLLRGSTDLMETSTLASTGGLVRRAQVELRHAFLRRLIGTAGAGIASTAYQGISINERLTDLNLGLEYYLSPEAVVFARYQHSAFRTNAATGDWDGDEVRVGLRIRR